EKATHTHLGVDPGASAAAAEKTGLEPPPSHTRARSHSEDEVCARTMRLGLDGAERRPFFLRVPFAVRDIPSKQSQ
ncbi:hypothetical protein KUCAC02_030463, partial [Chaenocephalus aceratus]